MLLAHLMDIHNLKAEVVRRCHKRGLRVSFDPNAKTAYTNAGEVVFPAVKPPITVEQLKLLWCQAIHEPGHHIRSEALRLLEDAKIKKDSPLGPLWNVVEDEHMERQIQKQWLGDRKGLIEGHAILARDMAESWGKHTKAGKKPTEDSVKAMSAYAVAMVSRLDWDDYAESNYDLLRRNLPSEALDLIDELIAEGWADRIAQGGDPHVTKELAYDLFRRLYPNEDPDDHTNQGEGEGESAGGDSEEGEGEGSEGKAPGKEMVVNWKDIVSSTHDTSEMGSPMNIEWDGKTEGKVDFFTDDSINVREPTESYSSFTAADAAERSFANQVRRLIQATTRTKRVNEMRSGKLDKRNMVRVLLPSREGGDWNRKVFYDTEETRSLNTAVTVLVDWSGSMSGEKMQMAAHAAQLLVSTFDRALKVPCEVVAFSAGWSEMDLCVVKSFAEKNVDSDKIGRRLTGFSDYTCGNADGDAMIFAAKRLLKRNEERKILIVLSDGSPSASTNGACEYSVLHAAIKEVRRLGIEPYGIGIMSDSVKTFYGNDCQVVRDARKLPEVLLGTLSTLVKRDK
jgi:Mg-chelatase subunit ChlD